MKITERILINTLLDPKRLKIPTLFLKRAADKVPRNVSDLIEFE